MTANHQRPIMLPVHDNRVYLRDPISGMWLNLSCEYLTHDKAYRWIGTAEQVANCRRKYPVAAKLKMVRSAAMPVFNSYH